VISEVPFAIPDTTPDVEPTVATEVAELDQVPPAVVLDQDAVEPTHIGVAPVIV